MKHYCNPMNLEYRYQFYRKLNSEDRKEPFKVYREAADPSLIVFKDTYFLFPSMTAGFFASTDLLDWEFYEFKGDMPIYDYAPDVRVMGEYMYFSASHMGENCNFYRTKDPRTEPFEEIEGTFPFWDPNLFIDDDGRVYFYWGCSNQEPIYGVELDPHTMHPLTQKQVMLEVHPETRGYERFGNEHIPPKSEEQIEAEVEDMLGNMKKQAAGQNTDIGMPEESAREMLRGYFGNRPYLEGAWMTKRGKKYYLQYAVPGTEYNIYGDGAYESDQPLGPFLPAANNPYSYKPGGFITGAGHGSTMKDKDGNFWHVSTMRISHNENFERRLGLWKAGFDAGGELFCDQRFGDWPIAMEAEPFVQPDWMLLSYGKQVTVSSGSGAENITDEDIRTFWKAESNRPGEWACIDLGTAFTVSGLQINFADDGLIKELSENTLLYHTMYEERYIDTKKQKTRWKLEGSVDGKNYFVISDKWEADTDYAHDFIELEMPVTMRYVRITVRELPYSQFPAIAGLRVFGMGDGALPGMAEDIGITYDGYMDMEVSWKCEGTVGSVILWGHEPEKLYHSRMVYGKKQEHIGALVTGQEVYIRIDTFNENGITQGELIHVEQTCCEPHNS